MADTKLSAIATQITSRPSDMARVYVEEGGISKYMNPDVAIPNSAIFVTGEMNPPNGGNNCVPASYSGTTMFHETIAFFRPQRAIHVKAFHGRVRFNIGVGVGNTFEQILRISAIDTTNKLSWGVGESGTKSLTGLDIAIAANTRMQFKLNMNGFLTGTIRFDYAELEYTID